VTQRPRPGPTVVKEMTMRDRLQLWIYRSFATHCGDHHNAEFEVCRRWPCWLAAWVEARLYHWLYGVWAEGP